MTGVGGATGRDACSVSCMGRGDAVIGGSGTMGVGKGAIFGEGDNSEAETGRVGGIGGWVDPLASKRIPPGINSSMRYSSFFCGRVSAMGEKSSYCSWVSACAWMTCPEPGCAPSGMRRNSVEPDCSMKYFPGLSKTEEPSGAGKCRARLRTIFGCVARHGDVTNSRKPNPRMILARSRFMGESNQWIEPLIAYVQREAYTLRKLLNIRNPQFPRMLQECQSLVDQAGEVGKARDPMAQPWH